MTAKVVKTVFIQNWEESERGWGTRPEGWTVHISLTQHRQYVNRFNEQNNKEDEVPDCYERPCGEPIEIECDIQLFRKIKKAAERKISGEEVKCVHGKGRLFSIRPLRPLKEIDLMFPKPKEKKKQPVSQQEDAH